MTITLGQIIWFNLICVCRFRHGFAFHMEVSFMETCVKRFLSELEDNESATLSKAGYRGMNKERMRKKCLLLISRIESIPTSVS